MIVLISKSLKQLQVIWQSYKSIWTVLWSIFIKGFIKELNIYIHVIIKILSIMLINGSINQYINVLVYWQKRLFTTSWIKIKPFFEWITYKNAKSYKKIDRYICNVTFVFITNRFDFMIFLKNKTLSELFKLKFRNIFIYLLNTLTNQKRIPTLN